MDINIDYDSTILKPNSLGESTYFAQIKENVEKWAKEMIELNNEEMDSTHYICKFYSRVFCNNVNVDKLILLAKASVWQILFDDFIEKNSSQIHKWLEVVSEGNMIFESSLEKMFSQFSTEMKKELTEYQRKRFTKTFIDLIEASYIDSERESDMLSISADDYLKFRRLNSNFDFYLLGIEYLLGISIEEQVFNSEDLKDLQKYFAQHFCIINDLYSFKKELLSDGAKINYVSVIKRINNCTLQESVNEILKQLKEIEYGVLRCIQHILSSGLSVPKEYLITIEAFIYENAQFHKNAIRYKI